MEYADSLADERACVEMVRRMWKDRVQAGRPAEISTVVDRSAIDVDAGRAKDLLRAMAKDESSPVYLVGREDVTLTINRDEVAEWLATWAVDKSEVPWDMRDHVEALWDEVE